MTKQFWFGLVLCVTLIATAGVDSVAAASCDTVLESTSSGADTDAFEEDDILATFLQWLDRILDSAAAGHTSVFSIWNH